MMDKAKVRFQEKAMNDSRERKLANGTSFRARTCPGLFAAQSLIEAAKGNGGQDEQGDITGGDHSKVAAYPTRLPMVGIADILVMA